MNLHRYPDPESAAAAAAAAIAQRLADAVETRGACTLALSGGHTAQRLLDALAAQPLPWHALTMFQVDERIAAPGDGNRNLTALRARLLSQAPVGWSGLRAMPVERDPRRAGIAYARELEAASGRPPVLDVAHLGLGADGHTASLVPGDPALDADSDVAVTWEYQGRRRLTLTFPCLARASWRVWLVTGEDKARVLARFLDADPELPASRLSELAGACFVDLAAAAWLRTL
ncbi:MAG: 6-phosphogluconolactonase [Pseudomonadales bacterium]